MRYKVPWRLTDGNPRANVDYRKLPGSLMALLQTLNSTSMSPPPARQQPLEAKPGTKVQSVR
jgi:hypothetical protein